MNARIDYLVNHRSHIPRLAAWLMDASPEFFAGYALSEVARDHFEGRLNIDSLPISFIALDDDVPVGTIALLSESITTHTHLTPWLGALYVSPEFRHRGTAMSLVAHALEKGREMGFESVYVGISRAEERYMAEGWRMHERTIYCGKPLCILKYEF